MNSLIEASIITELSCGSNFAYLLSDNTKFLLSEYKVLQSQGSDGFIKCMKLLYNGQIEMYYLTRGYKVFSLMLPTLNTESFLTIIANLFKAIIDVKTNGFLTCQNIDISFNKLYIDMNTLRVSLIYLPISQRAYDDYASFENELRTSLVKLVSNLHAISSNRLMQFTMNLSDGTLTLEELYSRMKGIKIPNKGTFRDVNVVTYGSEKLRIVSMDAPIRTEMTVNKAEFTIGKNMSAVDCAITYNKAISRLHCKISQTNSQYFITDLKSANGTYVNESRLQPNQAHLIVNGDIIRLANCRFRICIE